MTKQTEILTLYKAGQTAQQIYDALKDDPRHVRDCFAAAIDPDTPDLFDVLEGADLMDGGLEAAVIAVDSDALTAAWEKLKRYMTVNNRMVHCHSDADVGQLTTTIKQLAMQASSDNAEEIKTRMDALTGGVMFAGLTLAEVQSVIAEHAKDTALAAVTERHNREGAAAIAEHAKDTATPDSILAAAAS